MTTTHGTGWREDADGWSTVPSYCWCGKLARECPEPKIDVTAADMERAIVAAPHPHTCRCDHCWSDAMAEQALQQW
jgi:hypothetical protein